MNVFLYIVWGENDYMKVRNYLAVVRAMLFPVSVNFYELQNTGFLFKSEKEYSEISEMINSRRVKYLLIDLTDSIKKKKIKGMMDVETTFEEIKQMNISNTDLSLDGVLDKMSKYGPNSLSDEEWSFLELTDNDGPEKEN